MVATLLIISILLLVLVIFQLGRISDLVGALRGDEKSESAWNNINGILMWGFGIVFLVLIVWSVYAFKDRFLPPSASVHGVWVDNLFNITLLLTGIVFIATQVMLFYFSYRYRQRKGRKAYYYPENDRLEIIWTIIPAIVLTGLIIYGAYRWYQITGPAPDNATVVEVTGKQFNWIVRYPGEDGKLGKRNFKTISLVNKLGMLKKDETSHDDIVTSMLYLPVDKPVKVKIRARDVLHSFYLPHFRVKMDAVPGIPTTFWFKPKYTTEEMRKKTGNKEFEYVLACAELCGKGHSSMKTTVKVVSEKKYEEWLSQQTTWKQAMQQANKWEGLEERQKEQLKPPKKHKEHHGAEEEHGEHASEESGHKNNKISSL